MEDDPKYQKIYKNTQAILYGGLIGSILSHNRSKTDSSKNYYLSCFELCKNMALYIGGKPYIDPLLKNPNRAGLSKKPRSTEEIHNDRPRWTEGFVNLWEFLARNHREKRSYDPFTRYIFAAVLKQSLPPSGDIDYTRMFILTGPVSLLMSDNNIDTTMIRYFTQNNYKNTCPKMISILGAYIKILKFTYTGCSLDTLVLLTLEYTKTDPFIYPMINFARLISVDSKSINNIDIQIYGIRNKELLKEPVYLLCFVLAIVWKRWNSTLYDILEELYLYTDQEIVYIMVVQFFLVKNAASVDGGSVITDIINEYRYMEDFKGVGHICNQLAGEVYRYKDINKIL